MNDILFRKFCKVQDSVAPPYNKSRWIFQEIRQKIVCNDGFSFSCQASETHYSSPKETGLPSKDYKAWEIGYPSAPDTVILPFAEGEDVSDPIYPFVPTDIVISLIDKHGGIDYNA